MKKNSFLIITLLFSLITQPVIYSQKIDKSQAGIRASDLESHLSFLASPLLKGRANGSEGLEIAARYIASQALKIGLKPVNNGSFYSPYSVVRKAIDMEATSVEVIENSGASMILKEPLYQIFPMGGSDFTLEGEVVFAGYGIKADKFAYDDFDTLNVSGKILLIMNRAPIKADGTCAFGENEWLGLNGLQNKLQTLILKRPKAVLFVCDPKSGFNSVDEMYPEIMDYLRSSMTLKGQKSQSFEFPGMPKIIFVHRKVADELLAGSGRSLPQLQNEIDNDLKNHSFIINGKILRIKELTKSVDQQLPNIAGLVEGSDPILKNEIVIFSGHMDHIGGEGENINPGADDDGSGCAALLELAEAFSSLPVKPARSILFLWVSGEEVGLFGSESYTANPLFPLDKTVADLNMDMIGRVKELADSTSETPMTGPESVFVITCNQSKELVSIASSMAAKNKLNLDFSLSGRDHPLRLFARSDHFNFVKKDIPVLFFTSGLHTDYHKKSDTIEKIDFKKMEKIARTMFDIGFEVANRKARIIVDNPYSKWTAGSPGGGR